MTNNNMDKLIEDLSNLTILEASKLVTILKEKWNVSDTPMMAMHPMMNAAESDKKVEEVKTNFDVLLSSAGDKKIDVIKIIREITSLGLKESKDFVDGAPKMVKEGVLKEEAETIKQKLEAVGAKVELK